MAVIRLAKKFTAPAPQSVAESQAAKKFMALAPQFVAVKNVFPGKMKPARRSKNVYLVSTLIAHPHPQAVTQPLTPLAVYLWCFVTRKQTPNAHRYYHRRLLM
jgi:hypothetical protein